MLHAFGQLPAVTDTIAQASEILKQDIGKLIAEGPVEELNRTVNTQPVMLAASIAIYRAWLDAGGAAPSIVAGHSLGEYSALVAAGALSFPDAVELVRYRAQAMQEAVPFGVGGMAAILGLDDEAVRAACQEAVAGREDEIVEAVNYNAPAQVVIAGHKAAVERACEAAKARGAKRALPLPVSAPFHSSLMKPAADRLAERLIDIEFSAPQAAVINNVDVAVENDPAAIRNALVRQAHNPVRWVETVRKMSADGVTHVIECGPGKVLAGLTKRIDPSLAGAAIVDPASLDQVLELLK